MARIPRSWRGSAFMAVALALALASTLPLPQRVAAAPQILLQPSLPTNQFVGATINWFAFARNSGLPGDTLRYRFEIGLAGQPLNVRLDFGPRNFVKWVPIEEGVYTIRVLVKQVGTTTVWTGTASYVIRARATGTAVVTATQHPLVALYSAPACARGTIRVRFRAVVESRWDQTPWQPCNSMKTYNVYVAGLRAEQRYVLQHEIKDGATVTIGPLLPFMTGVLPGGLPAFSVVDPVDPATSSADRVVLHGIVFTRNILSFPVATDLAGRVVWYYPMDKLATGYVGPFLTSPNLGGTMMFHMSDLKTEGLAEQVLREVDLAGNTLRETNVERVNEQLRARRQDQITAFTHDAIRLPNGNSVVLGYVERILTDVQGPGPVNVLGDMIIVLDKNYQVTWTWNTFDHLDQKRKALLNETCSSGVIGCPLLRLSETANDWTHSNTIAYSQQDGNLLLSMRSQSWVVKVDYRNGAGTGKIVWRLGAGGDFTMTSTDPWPWFSHQHDVHYEGSQIIVFDNGNLRCKDKGPDCHSRGQLLNIDETTRRVSLAVNADLGLYAEAFGAAERLRNGNTHYTVGTYGLSLNSRSIEVRPAGSITYSLQANGISYRSFRMQDMYTP